MPTRNVLPGITLIKLVLPLSSFKLAPSITLAGWFHIHHSRCSTVHELFSDVWKARAEMLCSTCTICFISGDLESKLRSRMHAPLPHHETFDNFLNSVEEACIVCSAVWRSTKGRGRSMRREQNSLTQFSLEARRNAAGRSALSKSAKVITDRKSVV